LKIATDDSKLKICVVGMGYVGIPAAVLLAEAGHDVTGIQRRSKRSGWKIDWLNEGRCPIANEPELPVMLDRAVKAQRFRVTDDYDAVKKTQMILIDVQTPTDEKHIPKYESLQEVCHIIGKLLHRGQIVIIESTVAPGTTEHLVKPILKEESGLDAGLPNGFGLCFSYERVMVGRLIHNIREYPKIVGGIDETSTQKAIAMYSTIVRGGVHGTDPITAEVSKTVENAYRDVQIAFSNEVALLCESLGTDVYDVRKFVNGLPNDPSVPHANPVRNMHFPGAGVGGHCLPKDTWLLMHGYKKYGTTPEIRISKTENYSKSENLIDPTNSKLYPRSILEDARYINDWMPVHMVDLLEQALNQAGKTLKRAQIAVLGYAFLENSDDPRNTPTIPLLRELDKRGGSYKVHDPYVKEDEEYIIEHNLDTVLEGCDAVVLMTKHDVYGSLTPEKLHSLLKSQIIVDGRNLFEAQDYLKAGFIFKGIGKGKINKV
jgi:UDP-N-acetyl-D-mannosaminuronic acid dehydrogenase